MESIEFADNSSDSSGNDRHSSFWQSARNSLASCPVSFLAILCDVFIELVILSPFMLLFENI